MVYHTTRKDAVKRFLTNSGKVFGKDWEYDFRLISERLTIRQINLLADILAEKHEKEKRNGTVRSPEGSS